MLESLIYNDDNCRNVLGNRSELYQPSYDNELNESDFQYLREAFGVGDFFNKKILEKVKKNVKPKEFPDVIPRNHLINLDICENIKIHCTLMKNLINHDIATAKTPPHMWLHTFSPSTYKILSFHAKIKNIHEPYLSFAKWAAFTDVHTSHPISLENFLILADNLVETQKAKRNSSIHTSASLSKLLKFRESFKNGTFEEVTKECDNKNTLKAKENEIVKLFWTSWNKLQDSFLDFMRKLINPSKESESIDNRNILINIIELNRKIDKIHQPEEVEKRNFTELLKKSLIDGTIENLSKQTNQKLLTQAKHIEQKLNQLIKVLQFVQKHSRQFIQDFGQIFTS